MFDNFDMNQILFEYNITNPTDSSNLTTPFTIPGALIGSPIDVAATVTGEYSNFENYGIIGYNFEKDKFLTGINFVKLHFKYDVKNTGTVLANGTDLGNALGDLQSTTDTNRLNFETKYGIIRYSENETTSFLGTVNKNSYFSYLYDYTFRYNFGNNIVLAIKPGIILNSDDAHVFTTNIYLNKISKDKKTNCFTSLQYTKNLNTSNDYDVDSNVKVNLSIEQLIEGNNFVIAKLNYDITTLKSSNASIDNTLSYKISGGHYAQNKDIWYLDVDNWNLGLQ